MSSWSALLSHRCYLIHQRDPRTRKYKILALLGNGADGLSPSGGTGRASWKNNFWQQLLCQSSNVNFVDPSRPDLFLYRDTNNFQNTENLRWAAPKDGAECGHNFEVERLHTQSSISRKLRKQTMRSFISTFLAALSVLLLSNQAAAQRCRVCGDRNRVAMPDTVLFSIGQAGCEFVAGQSDQVPLEICPIFNDLLMGAGSVTCEDLEDEAERIPNALCDLLPEFIEPICGCQNPVEPNPFLRFITLLSQFFSVLFAS